MTIHAKATCKVCCCRGTLACFSLVWVAWAALQAVEKWTPRLSFSPVSVILCSGRALAAPAAVPQIHFRSCELTATSAYAA